MPSLTGGPDFGIKADTLEITNRIASPNPANFGGMLRRSGRMIYEDHLTDASALARWVTSVTGTGTVTMDGTKSFAGTNSVKLVTGAVSGQVAGAEKIIPAFSSRFGLDALVWIQATANWTLDLFIRYSPLFNATSSPKRLDTAVRIASDGGANFSLSYLTNPTTQTFTLVQSAFYSPTNAAWHELKLIADPTQMKLVKFYFDGFAFDLSTLAMFNSNISADFPYVDIGFLLTTNKASAETMWLDEIVVTTDEP